MTDDESLAQRTRAALDERTGFEEKKMFGGLAFHGAKPDPHDAAPGDNSAH
jgi:hypothetical protein